ncbi:MAG: signal peptidase I [Oscillospiraceae bacterium]|jgi:signal peptidase I|nr:signal peptidase I [Oscillospiraceae bacterium]
MPQDETFHPVDLRKNEMIRPEGSAADAGAAALRGKWVGSLYEMAEVLSSAVLCIAVLFTFVLRFAGVKGSSMTPTLKNGEWLAVTAILRQPERGDIVIISPRINDFHQPLVKRVVGVAGDELDLADGRVLINGQPAEEPYLPAGVLTYPAPELQSGLAYPLRVPEGRVFVMGDNRDGSADSRYSAVGFIRVDDILGRVSFRVNPFFVTKPSFEFTYKVN